MMILLIFFPRNYVNYVIRVVLTLGNLLNRSCSLGVNPKQTVPAWNENFKERIFTLI